MLLVNQLSVSFVFVTKCAHIYSAGIQAFQVILNEVICIKSLG